MYPARTTTDHLAHCAHRATRTLCFDAAAEPVPAARVREPRCEMRFDVSGDPDQGRYSTWTTAQPTATTAT
eukprot:2531050-Prymnesium_polylepis.1